MTKGSDFRAPVNCRSCKCLVWQVDIPSFKTGNCWRCEVQRLKDRVNYLEKGLNDIVEKCVGDPDTAQFADLLLQGDVRFEC